MFQTFISRHNSNFFSDKLVLTSVTPASSALVLHTHKDTSLTLYFVSLTVNSGIGFFFHCIYMDTSVIAVNVVVLFGVDTVFFFSVNFFFMLLLSVFAVCFVFCLLPFLLPSRLPMLFILWIVAMMVVIIPSRTV